MVNSATIDAMLNTHIVNCIRFLGIFYSQRHNFFMALTCQAFELAFKIRALICRAFEDYRPQNGHMSLPYH